MTPTLIGRWQSRIFLLATIGILFSLPFALKNGFQQVEWVYFWVLFYVGLFGLAWDILYNYLQKFLWDHDWPGVLQFIAAIVEGIFLALAINFVGLPYIPQDEFSLPTYIFHYSVVWVAVYCASWVVMRLLFPRARFRGGAWMGKWAKG
ncbi:hypothetical protein IQ247_16700 [Plectonema cf. radiosum LEGE 06105]|uniref:Uncharacterized protein n=1 Tax=Plectonema cf. radiosum LEGE 06105 TaxID=945769 RepID=A0A8J7K3L3_9CYAN|nr:hypothetical protein [Plectonema radiosum]MBE9214287.1 hypothetical protein [Plectonema cf. radiosum LEGE 06105]